MLWNTAYNSRDSLAFYNLFVRETIITSTGGRWVGAETCKKLCRFLYVKDPDMTWYYETEKIEVNAEWKPGYETGIWKEAWTEPNNKEKSQLPGRYNIMWRYLQDDWKIHSAIFTHLSCTGSYYTK